MLLAAIIVRVVALWGASEANVTPDGARFMNIARSIERGQGFSTPEAWPAWMNPERLPMAETFKEPGYPYAIAALRPLAGTQFRAGQLLSLLAGVAIPMLLFEGIFDEPDVDVATAVAPELLAGQVSP